MSSVNVQSLFGPFLIGAFINIFLYGILVIQSFFYFRAYRGDPARLRYFVLFLVFCDTVNSIFDIGVIYEPLVLRYGTPRALERVPIMLPVAPLLTVIISASVQSFICWRIRVITKSWIIPSFICIFIFSAFAGGVATCITGSIFNKFSQFNKLDPAVITWLGSSAVADISITISLVVSLTKRRTSNEKTNDAIDRIIRLTIHTGAVTAIFATLDVVLFVAIPDSTFNFVFDFALTKLYTNSLLSTLNARRRYDTEQDRPQDNVLFGPSSWNTSSKNSDRSIQKRNRNMYTHNMQMTSISSDVVDLSGIPPTRHKSKQAGASFSIDLESAADGMIEDTSLNK